jgi:hypothetical protein
MNVLHSRRKRERRKVEAEVFHEQVADLEQSNEGLRADNLHLEELVQQANAMVARIEGLRHPVEMAHASSAANDMPSASLDMADLIRARQSLAQQQLIQQALTQQSLVPAPFPSNVSLAPSSGGLDRQFLNQGNNIMRESHLGGASNGTFGQQFGQGQHFPDESNHRTGSELYGAMAHMGSDPTALASSPFAPFACPAPASLYPTGPDRLGPPPSRLDAAAQSAAGQSRPILQSF